MQKILMALCLFVGLITASHAGPWNGAADMGAAIQMDVPIVKVACDHNEFYCRRGSQRICRGGRCDCVPCGGRPYSRYDGPPPRAVPYGYDRPRHRRAVCPPRYTMQDGVCKPYRGY